MLPQKQSKQEAYPAQLEEASIHIKVFLSCVLIEQNWTHGALAVVMSHLEMQTDQGEQICTSKTSVDGADIKIRCKSEVHICPQGSMR